MTWESDHVEAARARGVSWQHIAHQVGKCELDIRARYGQDDTVLPVAEFVPVPVRRRGPPPPPPIKLSILRNRVLAAICDHGPVAVPQVAAMLPEVSRKAVSTNIAALHFEGAVEASGEYRKYLYRITTRGLRRLGQGE